jgi:hypothetical protein
VHASTGVSRTPLIQFAASGKILGTTDIYASTSPKEKFILIAENLTGYTWTVPEQLAANTTYYWYYVFTPTLGRPYTSPTYYFKTGSL